MSERIPFGDEVSPDEAAALERLSGELRDEAGPALDFDAMEARLRETLDAEPARRSTSGRWWFAAPVVVAAAAASWLALGSSRAPTPTAPVTLATRAPATATQSEHVEGARAFSRPGFASWSFDEQASADVEATAERVTVRLLRGSVRVEVVPGHAAERFVVVAAGARVAVHGTVFKVALGERVRVDVERGIVAVGPVDRPAVWRLTAPAGGTFSRDAASGEVGELAPFTTARPGVSASVSAPVGKPPPRDAPLEPAALRERLTTLTQACFARRFEGSRANVTFDTRATVTSGARGVTVSFDPPLEPSVEQCVRDGAAALRGTSTVEQLSLSLVSRR